MDIEQFAPPADSQPRKSCYCLTGRFDAHEIERFKMAIEPISSDIELDLSGVRFIDSSGLAALVWLYRQSTEKGFSLRIIRLQDPVRLIFEITKLLDVLPVVLEPETASANVV